MLLAGHRSSRPTAGRKVLVAKSTGASPRQNPKTRNLQRKAAFSFESWLLASLAGENSLLGRPTFSISSVLCWVIPAKSQANFVTSRLLASYRRRKSRFQGGICESEDSCRQRQSLRSSPQPTACNFLNSRESWYPKVIQPRQTNRPADISATREIFTPRFGHNRETHHSKAMIRPILAGLPASIIKVWENGPRWGSPVVPAP